MKKFFIWVLLICIMPAANFAQSTSQSKANKDARKALADSLENAWKGQRKWLKIDVLTRDSGNWSKEDVTYIHQNATAVQYKTFNLNKNKEIRSTSTDEFVKEVLSIGPYENINLLERGSLVTLHSVKFGKNQFKETEIKIGLINETGEKAVLKFIIIDTDYTIEQIQKPFTIAFSDTNWSDDSTPRAFAKKIIGQKKWLRLDVINIQGNRDTTDEGTVHIFPNGKIYHKVHYYSYTSDLPVSYQTESIIELENEVRQRFRNVTTEIWSRGTQVTIYAVYFVAKWKKSDYHAQIGITNFRGDKTTINVVFDFNGNIVEQFQRAFAIAFADSESELHETGQAVKLSLGMSIDDVIKMKGQPKTRADLGAKTVFTYDDVKVIFQDGKLVDVQ